MTSFDSLVRNSIVFAGTSEQVAPEPGSSIVHLVTAALEQAVLAQGVQSPDPWPQDGPATIIRLPSSDWIAPLTVAIEGQRGKVWTCQPRERADTSPELETLPRTGTGVGVWVTHQGSAVPPMETQAAERVVTVTGLTASIIARTIEIVSGGAIAIEDEDWTGMSLPMVAAAIRSDITPDACRTRLRRVSRLYWQPDPQNDRDDRHTALPLSGEAAQSSPKTLAPIKGPGDTP